jgi:hypothetical protein
MLERIVRAALLWIAAGTAFGATPSSPPTFARNVVPILQKKADVVRPTMRPWQSDLVKTRPKPAFDQSGLTRLEKCRGHVGISPEQVDKTAIAIMN